MNTMCTNCKRPYIRDQDGSCCDHPAREKDKNSPAVEATMTRERAIKLAQTHAERKPEKYYKAPSFMPHEWVIDVVQAAYDLGVQEGQR